MQLLQLPEITLSVNSSQMLNKLSQHFLPLIKLQVRKTKWSSRWIHPRLSIRVSASAEASALAVHNQIPKKKKIKLN